MQPAHDLTFADFTALLRARDFGQLFNRLGWDNIPARTPEVRLTVPGEAGALDFTFRPVKQKHGFVVLHCAAMPEAGQRRRLSLDMSKKYAEHLLIFAPAEAAAGQLWQLVVRDPGEPVRYFEFRVGPQQQPRDLWNRVEGLAISLDDDERGLTLAQVRERTRRAFALNAEKVTKKFYTEFSKQHQAFQALIQGIEGSTDRAWYTSIMLNRVMFIYFVQAQGYLLVHATGPSGEADKRYLAYKLEQCARLVGKDQFQSFYRDFLRVLFRDGLNTAQRPHDPATQQLLGRVPYLNGGLFEEHELERANPRLHIPDKAFEQLFAFLSKWDWILDSRRQATGTTINPDVIGYIFERYINERAQMGAYYTKEDITEYITKNCLVPALMDRIAATVPHESEVWNLLRDYPRRYLYPAQLRGIDLPLPADVEAARTNVAARTPLWNRPTPDDYALPTEIWRETVQRRDRAFAAQARLLSGEVRSINELITLNLDVRQFLHDAIANSGSAEWVWACFEALRSLSILDPTCGSGAFLFAALRLLEPLYQECLDRMEAFLPELDNPKVLRVKKEVVRGMQEVRRKLVEEHLGNRAYFITKTIILHNLYGVDLMHEAVEIAKLRLFLQLMSTLPEPDYTDDNLGLEPLPDVDFNIRAGNTLVGFATRADLKKGLAYDLDGVEAEPAILGQADVVARVYAEFRRDQDADDQAAARKAKSDLQAELDKLNEKLNTLLHKQNTTVSYADFCQRYQPFHWFAEFYEVVTVKGGFDVIIGNPPYVEYAQVRDIYRVVGYDTEKAANLFAFTIERAFEICANLGYVGMIIPISAFANQSMESLQKLVKSYSPGYVSSFHQRPASLFDGVLQRLSIAIVRNDKQRTSNVFTTSVQRWYTDTRQFVFEKLSYVHAPQEQQAHILKLESALEVNILSKYLQHQRINFYTAKIGSSNSISYRTAGGGYWVTFLNSLFDTNSLSNKRAFFQKEYDARVFSAALNSNLFWWYYSINFDQFNFKDYMIFAFRFSYPSSRIVSKLVELSEHLEKELLANATTYTINSKTRGAAETITYNKFLSKETMDEIDRVLAQHYGFTDEELDFIINYDIKYRMGAELPATD